MRLVYRPSSIDLQLLFVRFASVDDRNTNFTRMHLSTGKPIDVGRDFSAIMTGCTGAIRNQQRCSNVQNNVMVCLLKLAFMQNITIYNRIKPRRLLTAHIRVDIHRSVKTPARATQKS